MGMNSILLVVITLTLAVRMTPAQDVAYVVCQDFIPNIGPIPSIGLGVYKTPPGPETKNAVVDALRAGYRHIDTAQLYLNEKDVGDGIRESGVNRSEIFVTSKVWTGVKSIDGDGFKFVIDAVSESLKKSGLDYIDLMLLHSPHHPSERLQRWAGLVEAQRRGFVRHIGVSNYGIGHLQELFANSTVHPLVNQIEIHVFLARIELVDFCFANGLIVEAYSPLAKGTGMSNDKLQAVATQYGKSPAQVMLRFLLQRGLVVLPKSVHLERMQENIDLFDFELSKETMIQLLALDEGLTGATGWDPTTLA